MLKTLRFHRFFAHAAGATVLCATAAMAAPVAQPVAAASPTAAPAINFAAESRATLDLSTPDLNYSSSAVSSDAVSAERFSLSPEGSGEAQPPMRRRRYGRPRYSDKLHNADGSNRLAFVAGGGFTLPTGATGRRTNLSYGFKGGAGINFNRRFGVMAEYNYDHFGIQGRVLNSQQDLYNQYILDQTGDPTQEISGLDGNTHLWSLTLNPTYTFHESDKSSAYVVVGGGFYRKVVNFTIPSVGTYCDPYYGCYQVATNQVFDHYSNNAGGINGGIGFTYKPSRFAGERFFAEARYVEVFNSASANSVVSLYPPANARTGYIPVTFGVRF